MKILVANLGSTSFKYRLFDMDGEKLLARGGVERIGAPVSPCFVESGGTRADAEIVAKDHAAAVTLCLEQLSQRGCLKDPSELAAIGFKAVHAKDVSGAQRVDERVLAAMQAYADVAPAHNPPYINAMRLLASKLPQIPLVASFETGFHETISAAERSYAIPHEWIEKHGVKKWGFHGASHRYIAMRTADLLKNPNAKIISFHLGGSNSVCAISEGKSRANSLGMSPQSGLPHNNRVGDLDAFALPFLMRSAGVSLDEAERVLCRESGLKGLSGISNDVRDPVGQAAEGNGRAQLALEVYAHQIRHWIGAYYLELNGLDALVFTAGIGENQWRIRQAVCEGLDQLGIRLDAALNERQRATEGTIGAADAPVRILVIPTNEELVVAREVKRHLENNPNHHTTSNLK